MNGAENEPRSLPRSGVGVALRMISGRASASRTENDCNFCGKLPTVRKSYGGVSPD